MDLAFIHLGRGTSSKGFSLKVLPDTCPSQKTSSFPLGVGLHHDVMVPQGTDFVEPQSLSSLHTCGPACDPLTPNPLCGLEAGVRTVNRAGGVILEACHEAASAKWIKTESKSRSLRQERMWEEPST